MRISDWSSDVCSSDLVEVADVARVEPAILVDGRLGLHGTPPVARHHHRAPHQDLPCLAAIHCDAVLIDDPQLDVEAGLTGRGEAGTTEEVVSLREVGVASDRFGHAVALDEHRADDLEADRKSTRLNSSH